MSAPAARPGNERGTVLSPDNEALLPDVVAILASTTQSLTVREVQVRLPHLRTSRVTLLLKSLERRGQAVRGLNVYAHPSWRLVTDRKARAVHGCSVKVRPDGAAEVRLGLRAVCLSPSRATPEAIEAAARRLTEAA